MKYLITLETALEDLEDLEDLEEVFLSVANDEELNPPPTLICLPMFVCFCRCDCPNVQSMFCPIQDYCHAKKSIVQLQRSFAYVPCHRPFCPQKILLRMYGR